MTPLHALFVRRVEEELADKELNPTQLQKYGAVQRTLADALKKGTDLRLKTLYRTATALGMEAWQLLRERPESKQIPSNITPFPARPSILRQSEPEPYSTRKQADRKKKRR